MMKGKKNYERSIKKKAGEREKETEREKIQWETLIDRNRANRELKVCGGGKKLRKIKK